MKENNKVPFGKTIPAENIHGVSVSLPFFQDIIDSKEIPEISQKLESGYPRFFDGKFYNIAKDFLRTYFKVQQSFEIILLPSEKSILYINKKMNTSYGHVYHLNIYGLLVPENDERLPDLKLLIQHTGIKPYSRQLEDFLQACGILSTIYSENRQLVEPIMKIKSVISQAYKTGNEENVILSSCGMNSVNAVFESIKNERAESNKNIFIQFGWLYLDTIEILKKYSENHFEIISVFDKEQLENFIHENYQKIAGVFTEIPTNPFLYTCDLPHLSYLCKTFGIPLVVDATIATPYNVDILNYCDFAVESLSKFASGNADLLAGAVIANPKSVYAKNILSNIYEISEDLYFRDAKRLALGISSYENRISTIRKSIKPLTDYFKSSPKIKKVYWSHSPENIENYKKIEKEENSYSPLISVEFSGNFAEIYDKLEFAKGPSLGTEFTLIMPYFYLAHYNEIKTPEGKKLFEEKGINPEMVRISVGTEPIEELIRKFELALA